MDVVLAGQRSFGLAVYHDLLNSGHNVVGVWSPEGDDPLTRRAQGFGDWEPPIARSPQRVAELGRESTYGDVVDLFVCAHSHDFISKAARGATKLGGIGYHPSLLPRHRGRDAVEWTIRMGDPIAGGSVYWLTDSVDGGPIAAQEHVHVPPGWDASRLWRKRLFPLGVALLEKTMRDLSEGLIVEVPQDERCATWEPSIGRPPLHRPDLTQIGAAPNGYRVKVGLH